MSGWHTLRHSRETISHSARNEEVISSGEGETVRHNGEGCFLRARFASMCRAGEFVWELVAVRARYGNRLPWWGVTKNSIGVREQHTLPRSPRSLMQRQFFPLSCWFDQRSVWSTVFIGFCLCLEWSLRFDFLPNCCSELDEPNDDFRTNLEQKSDCAAFPHSTEKSLKGQKKLSPCMRCVLLPSSGQEWFFKSQQESFGRWMLIYIYFKRSSSVGELRKKRSYLF